jgi:hypothetical protein
MNQIGPLSFFRAQYTVTRGKIPEKIGYDPSEHAISPVPGPAGRSRCDLPLDEPPLFARRVTTRHEIREENTFLASKR